MTLHETNRRRPPAPRTGSPARCVAPPGRRPPEVPPETDGAPWWVEDAHDRLPKERKSCGLDCEYYLG
jgi:hypothetical protein